MPFITQKNSKKMTAILIGVFLFVQVFGLAWPSPAKAQFGQEAAAIISWAGIQEGLEAAAMGGLISSVSYFMRKLAYDSARWIASGGSGQGALAFQNGFGSYLAETAGDSVATAVEEFGKPFGLNLCQLPDINLRVSLQIGFRRLYDTGGGAGGPKPSCTFQKLKNGWSPEAFENQFGAGGSKFISETFSNAISIKEGDFGIALTGMAAVDRITTGNKTANILDRNEGGGFQPLIDLISGRIKTPSGLIKEEATALTAKNQAAASQNQISGIYGSKLKAVLPMAANVFLNTLTGELLNKAKKGLFDLIGGGSGTGADGGFVDTTSFYSQGLIGNKKLADKAFSFFLTGVPTKQLSSYYNDLVAQFASCPENPGINNCVIDTGLQTLLEEARNGRPMTIAEALTSGNLHGDWPLISPRRTTDNTNKTCYNDNKYCYSNIQKLRKARILPLGFEIAALKADPDNIQNWTLDKIVKGFEDCDGVGDLVYPSINKPFCHLIDPNWVIRMPDVRCEAEVYGELMSDYAQGIRQRECADMSSCILEDDKGQCTGQYGYCLTEKNEWQLGGTSCPAQYNTCNTFIARDGETSSYLARSVDYSECNVDNVGCLPYSTELASDKWVNSASSDISLKINQGRNQTIYFNDKIKSLTCSANDDGCTAFNLAVKDRVGQYGPSSQAPINLRKAPDYLQCYDSTPTDPIIDWPETKTDLNKIVKNEKCNSFASVCLPEEVDCEAYTPVSNGGPTVPAVVGGNSCPGVCVGYDVFKQEKSNFEALDYPLYFIPTEAQTCSASNVGCSEFTNLDEVAKGGEGKEYYSDLRYCERPTGDNEGTYYSWEGSASEGYVLRVHKMMKISQDEFNYIINVNPTMTSEANSSVASFFEEGSPAYVDDTKEVLELNVAICNAQNYNNLINNQPGGANPDCRALYDKDGKVFYRLYQQTATVSEACHPLRKTEANLYLDPTITNSQICTSTKSGLWNSSNNTCQRCYKGGRYENGNCVYWAISGAGESTTCPATANGCRAYTGTTAGNVQEIFFAGFEEATGTEYSFWSPKNGAISVSPESIQVGLHSLQVSNNQSVSRNFSTGTLNNGDWYELRFWAKSLSEKKVEIYFLNNYSSSNKFTVNPSISADSKISLGANWREYKLGPVQFTGDGKQPVSLVFQTSDIVNVSYFIDNVRLTRVQDSLYLIKNSWKRNYGDGVVRNVPLACDSNQRDTFPGEALGCEAYTNSVGANVNATGFERLCRGEAIGCTAMYDTHNTLAGENADKEQVYNVYCSEGIGATNVQTKCLKDVGGRMSYSCDVETGKTGCFITGPIIISDDLKIVNDEILLMTETYVPRNLTTLHEIESRVVALESLIDGTKSLVGSGRDSSRLYRDFIETKLSQININVGNIIDLVENNIYDDDTKNRLIEKINNINGVVADIEYLLGQDEKLVEDYPGLQNFVSGVLRNTKLIEDKVLGNSNITSFENLIASKGAQETVKNYIKRLVGSSTGGIRRLVGEIIHSYVFQATYPFDDKKLLLGVKISGVDSQLFDLLNMVNSAGFGQDTIGRLNDIKNTILPGLNTDVEGINYYNFSGQQMIEKNTIIVGKVSEISAGIEYIKSGILNSKFDDALFVVTSTVIIPADTPSSSPIYLTNRSEFSCSANSRGCQKLGLETQVLSENSQVAYSHSETMLFNNPDNYSSTLCRAGEVGCEEFKSGNSISYFKDPSLVGNKFCNYVDPSVSNGNLGGWFKTGVGECSDNKQLCKDKNDCAEGIQCERNGQLPCYDNYLSGSSGYGLWSNGSEKYGGWVGQCSSEYDRCKELVDHTDLTDINYPEGRPYYVIFDNLISNKNEDCGGKVSQKSGCVLFDKTEEPQKMFSSLKTYQASASLTSTEKYGPVNPQSDPLTNDSNLILKVNRTRTCNTWLACQSSASRVDDNGNTVKICYNYGVCNKTSPGIDCQQWVDTSLSVKDAFMPDPKLDEDFYVSRDTSWYGMEYSGMSLFDKYSIANLYKVSSESGDIPYLTFKLNDAINCTPNSHDGDACGFPDNMAGKCYKGNCFYPVGDEFSSSAKTVNQMASTSAMVAVSCKAYPEVDSPISADAVEKGGSVVVPGLGNLDRNVRQTIKEPYSVETNICQDGDNCSCSYKRLTYANGKEDFWPFGTELSNIPTGICSGGNDGEPCKYDNDCSITEGTGQNIKVLSTGVCSPLRAKKISIGMDGFCLERDISRPLPGLDPKKPKFPCLTWLPADTSVSGLDLYNNYPEAGYYPNVDYDAVLNNKVYGQVYCTDATGNGEGADSKIYNDKFNVYKEDNIGRLLKEGSEFENVSGLMYAFGFYKKYYDPYDPSKLVSDGIKPAWLWPFFAINFYGDATTDFVTRMYNWVFDWARYTDPEDTIENSTNSAVVYPDKNPNSVVLYVRNPKTWFDYFQKKFGTDVNWVFTNPVSYEFNQDLYERDIKNIRFAPVIFPERILLSGLQWTIPDYPDNIANKIYLEGQAHPFGWVYSEKQGLLGALMSSDVYIDFDKLRSDIANYRTADSHPLKDLAYIGDKLELDDDWVSRRVYTYRDTVEIDGPNNGKIRYVVVIPLDKNVNDGKLTQQVDYFYTGVAPVDPISNLNVTIDFDSKTGKLLSKLPLTWGGTFNISADNSSVFWTTYKDMMTGRPDLAAVANLHPRCTEFSLVYKEDLDNPADETNQAWTNRVWKGALEVPSYVDSPIFNYDLIKKSTTLPPFGSLDLSAQELLSSGLWWPYNFIKDENRGVPYACQSDLFSSLSFHTTGGIDLGNCADLPVSEELSEAIKLSPPFYDLHEIAGKEALKNLFAKVYAGSLSLNIISGKREIKESNESIFYTDLSVGSGGTPNFGSIIPQVYSLNPVTCFDNNDSTPCVAGEFNNMTVATAGRVANGTMTDYDKDPNTSGEDINGDQQPDEIVAYGNLSVSLDFFATADDNMMPIRQVKVDWKDGTPIMNDVTKGRYKNQKPYCESSDIGGSSPTVGRCYVDDGNHTTMPMITGMTCMTDEDCSTLAIGNSHSRCFMVDDRRDGINSSVHYYPEYYNVAFGDVPRACEEKYFEFNHTYSCTPDFVKPDWKTKLSPNTVESMMLNGVNDSNKVCIFQPKVQVMDNWGYCNYLMSDDILYMKDYQATTNFNCNNLKAWTTYKGKIVIVNRQ